MTVPDDPGVTWKRDVLVAGAAALRRGCPWIQKNSRILQAAFRTARAQGTTLALDTHLEVTSEALPLDVVPFGARDS
jgi:hypothetical protein